MFPLCYVLFFTWSIYSIKSPTSWNHKYILFTPSIHHPVICNKTHYYYGPSGSDTSVWCAARLWWGHGHLEPWRWRSVEGLVRRGWLVVTSAECWQWPHYLPPPAGLQQSQQTRDTINFHPQTFLNKHGLRSDKKIASKRIVFWMIGVTVWIWCRCVMIP